VRKQEEKTRKLENSFTGWERNRRRKLRNYRKQHQRKEEGGN
jgi:hypothetical protein